MDRNDNDEFSITDKEKYNIFCANNENLPIYLQPFWLDAVCVGMDWDVCLYEKKGEIIAALPYCIKKVMGIKYITQPPFVQFMGCWIEYSEKMVERKKLELEKEVMSYFITEIEKKEISFYQQNFGPFITNWLPFYWNGYKQTTRYTYRITDISDIEKVYEDFNKNKKKNIKKVEKSNFSIKFDLPAKDFYNLHKNTLLQTGIKIDYSFELFERMYKAAYQNGAGRTIYAENEQGEVVAALFNVWDKKIGYDLISALDQNYRKTGILDALVYNMICFLSDKVKIYDFEGSMIEGVENSFRSFGAVQTPYFSIKKITTNNFFIKLAIKIKMD